MFNASHRQCRLDAANGTPVAEIFDVGDAAKKTVCLVFLQTSDSLFEQLDHYDAVFPPPTSLTESDPTFTLVKPALIQLFVEKQKQARSNDSHSVISYDELYYLSSRRRFTALYGVYISVVPYGVLGQQQNDSTQLATKKPDRSMVICDPAGVEYMNGKTPVKYAGTASGAIYKYIELKGNPDYKIETADAVYKEYNKTNVIHVIGPIAAANDTTDFESNLAAAYAAVFKALLFKSKSKKITCLRLLPISSGKFAEKSNYYSQSKKMARATQEAVDKALERTNGWQREQLSKMSIEMCIYNQEEFAVYKKAFEREEGEGG